MGNITPPSALELIKIMISKIIFKFQTLETCKKLEKLKLKLWEDIFLGKQLNTRPFRHLENVQAEENNKKQPASGIGKQQGADHDRSPERSGVRSQALESGSRALGSAAVLQQVLLHSFQPPSNIGIMVH